MQQQEMRVVEVFGVPVFDGTREEALAEVTRWLEGDEMRVVLTPTTEQIVMGYEELKTQNSKLKTTIDNSKQGDEGRGDKAGRIGHKTEGSGLSLLECFRRADLNVADAVGVKWAARRAGAKRVERYAGVDLMRDLFTEALWRGKKVFLLGGGKGVAKKAAETLFGKLKAQSSKLKAITQNSKLKAPQLAEVARGRRNEIRNSKSNMQHMQLEERVGWDEGAEDVSRETEEEARRVIEKINDFGADVLFVAYGAPWQEQWVIKHRDELTVKVAMGVGGAMDMWAGKVARAPLYVRKIGLEWWWRLLYQPWRWRRQMRLLKFLGMMVRS